MRKGFKNSNRCEQFNLTKFLAISALLLCFVSITVCIFTLCAFGNKKIAYDEYVVEECKKDLYLFLNDMGIDDPSDEIFNFEVTYNKRTHAFTVSDTLSEEPCTIELGEEPEVCPPPENTRPVKDKETLALIQKSKNLVFKYIENSSILKNKEDIYEYINNLSFEYLSIELSEFFLNVDFMDTVAVYFKDHVYLNPVEKNLYCEWIFVHEMIHAIKDFTHGFKTDEFSYTLFDECMTEIITYSMNPALIEESGYFDYIEYVVPYVGMFGKKAIEAYFYDYESIYKVYSKDAFLLYVESVENMWLDEYAYIMTIRSIGKMYSIASI